MLPGVLRHTVSVPQLSPVEPSFVTVAPHRVKVTAEVAAPPDAVWSVIANNASWTRWFPTMTRCEATSEPAGGVGSTRSIKAGPLALDEVFIIWQPGVAWGFTVIGSNLPLASRMLEMLEFEAIDGGATLVTYTGAFTPSTLVRPVFSLVKKRVETVWRGALTGLGAYVTAAEPDQVEETDSDD